MLKSINKTTKQLVEIFTVVSLLFFVLVACSNDEVNSNSNANENINNTEDNEIEIERDALPFDSEIVISEYMDKVEEDSIANVVNDETNITMIDGSIYDVSSLLESITNNHEVDINYLTDTIAKELESNGYLNREYVIEDLIINVLAVDITTINLTIFKEGD